MDPDLAQALDPVLRDLRRTGGPVPRVTEELPDDGIPRSWLDEQTVWLLSEDGTGIGVFLQDADGDAVGRLERITDAVQGWAIEDRWTRDSNWPACLQHPTTHPMVVRRRTDEVWWCCPTDDVPVAQVGSLGADSSP